MSSKRKLGRSGIEVSAVGMGCWAIGGPMWMNENPVGWGEVNDQESMRAIDCGIDHGITFIDTADVYGGGHSERVVGKALAGKRQAVVIATKFGNTFDQQSRQITGEDAGPEYIRSACEASLKRLDTDYIDLYQLHINKYDPARVGSVSETLEQLVGEGKIRWYGWSTDFVEGVEVFAASRHCTAIQQRLNIFEGSTEVLALCEQQQLASINRGPLGMGLLTGKFSADTEFPEDDVRHSWSFSGTDHGQRLQKLDAIGDVLRSGGRTLAQGALAWLLARSPATVPIPGFKTCAQIEENAAALRLGCLSEEQMNEIGTILDDAQ